MAKLTTAWTQCTVPALTQTRSPGLCKKRYTGIFSANKSSKIGHHDPCRKFILFLQTEKIIIHINKLILKYQLMQDNTHTTNIDAACHSE